MQSFARKTDNFAKNPVNFEKHVHKYRNIVYYERWLEEELSSRTTNNQPLTRIVWHVPVNERIKLWQKWYLKTLPAFTQVMTPHL